jgi:hypothetical protein
VAEPFFVDDKPRAQADIGHDRDEVGPAMLGRAPSGISKDMRLRQRAELLAAQKHRTNLV